MAEAPAHGHERKDANVRGVMWVAAGLVAAALIIHVGLWFYERALSRLYPSPEEATRIKGPKVEIPPPRLQRDPASDWQELRATDEAALRSYGWVDRNAGVIRVPIERAMELIEQRGLPVRDRTKPNPEKSKGEAQ